MPELRPPVSDVRGQAIWYRVYETSMETYRSIPGYYVEDAVHTADIVAKTMFPGGRKEPMRGLPRMPDTGRLVFLGTFKDVHTAAADGHVYVHSFALSDRVPLLWSRKLRALVIVPGLKMGACQAALVDEGSDQILRTWAKGRGARCGAPVNVPNPPLPHCQAGVAVSYRSDKFTHGTPKDYIHHFDAPGVKVWFGRGKTPAAIFIRGGKLRIETHGIAG